MTCPGGHRVARAQSADSMISPRWCRQVRALELMLGWTQCAKTMYRGVGWASAPSRGCVAAQHPDADCFVCARLHQQVGVRGLMVTAEQPAAAAIVRLSWSAQAVPPNR